MDKEKQSPGGEQPPGIQEEPLEAKNRMLEERLKEAERLNSNMINLLVASYRLHSSLDYVGIIRTMKEIIINLVGAEVFGIFLVDTNRDRLVMVTNEGFDKATLPECEKVAKKVLSSGEIWLAGAAKMKANSQEPVAGIPLVIGERTLGVIVLQKLLVQKEGFQPQDFELFELLGKHASTALYAAKLFHIFETEKRMNIRHEINDLLPPRPSSPLKYLKVLDLVQNKKK